MAALDDRLLRQNPWWSEGKEGIERDPHLERYRDAAVQWDPPILSRLRLEPGDTHTLRGPRQSGKTTTLKRLIGRLLRAGERRVLYYSFDLESGPEAIYDVIERTRTLHPGPDDGVWYLFLDEVTSLENWQAGLKHAWDSGLTRDDFVLATGSSAHDVRKGAEQLPGRRGEGQDLLQLPMSFRDFCRATGEAEVPSETLPAAEMVTAGGIREIARRAYLDREQLQRAFRIYRRVGGFPAAVSDWAASQDVRTYTVQDLWRTVAGDVAKQGLDQTAAVKLLEEVSRCLGSRMSWSSAADAMDMKSPKGAKRYAHFLGEAFALLIVHFWDRGGGTLRPQKMRKVYFADPLFARIPPSVIPGAREPDIDGVVENLVAIALFRSAASSMVQATPSPGSVAYWRASGSGREIDFLIPRSRERKDRFPIEVKGDSTSGISAARKAISQSFGQGLVLTRSVWQPDGDVPAIPIPTFLACLGDRLERS